MSNRIETQNLSARIIINNLCLFISVCFPVLHIRLLYSHIHTHVIHFFSVISFFLLSLLYTHTHSIELLCVRCVYMNVFYFFSLLFSFIVSIYISIWLFRLMNVRTRICLLSVEFLVFGLCRSLFFEPQSKYTWTHMCVRVCLCARL